MKVPYALLEFMWISFGPRVRFCTEYVRDVYTFRCHPAYQSDNPIYDWMTVNFVVYDRKLNTEVTRAYPCRLAAVVVREMDDMNTEPYHLIVQSASHKTNVKSVLLTEWWWSEQYHVILPSNIAGPCFVISIKADMSKILETLPLDKWASKFTRPIDEDSLSSDEEDE